MQPLIVFLWRSMPTYFMGWLLLWKRLANTAPPVYPPIAFSTVTIPPPHSRAKSPRLMKPCTGSGTKAATNSGAACGTDKFVRKADKVPRQLYHLSQDIGESNDLAAAKPDLLKSLVA